jgi:hypothetical protein
MFLDFLSDYLTWVGEIANLSAEAIGHIIADRLNKDTDRWWHTAIKFCVFAVVYPALTIGMPGVFFLASYFVLQLILRIVFQS